MLRDNLIHVALCHADGLDLTPDYEAEVLRTEELVIITAAGDPLSALDEVSAKDLAEASIIAFTKGASIHQALVEALASEGLAPRIEFESADMSTTFSLVRRGIGVALVPRSTVEVENKNGVPVTAIPIGPARIYRQVAIAYKRQPYISRAVRAFVDLARNIIAGDREFE